MSDCLWYESLSCSIIAWQFLHNKYLYIFLNCYQYWWNKNSFGLQLLILFLFVKLYTANKCVGLLKQPFHISVVQIFINAFNLKYGMVWTMSGEIYFECNWKRKMLTKVAKWTLTFLNVFFSLIRLIEQLGPNEPKTNLVENLGWCWAQTNLRFGPFLNTLYLW